MTWSFKELALDDLEEDIGRLIMSTAVAIIPLDRVRRGTGLVDAGLAIGVRLPEGAPGVKVVAEEIDSLGDLSYHFGFLPLGVTTPEEGPEEGPEMISGVWWPSSTPRDGFLALSCLGFIDFEWISPAWAC